MPKAVHSRRRQGAAGGGRGWQALPGGLGRGKVLDCQEDVSRRKGVTQMGTAQ